MTVPLTIEEQLAKEHFVPDHAIALYFGMPKFDEVLYQDKNGDWVQKTPDIPQAKQDCDDLRACFEKYNIRDHD